MFGAEEEMGLMISRARATRGLGRPSFDARSGEILEATPGENI
jgi:hypothetical protein